MSHPQQERYSFRGSHLMNAHPLFRRPPEPTCKSKRQSSDGGSRPSPPSEVSEGAPFYRAQRDTPRRPTIQGQIEAIGRCHILVHAAGRALLNETAAAILSLCDGTRSHEEIVEQIGSTDNCNALANGVRTFLKAAKQRGWIDYA